MEDELPAANNHSLILKDGSQWQYTLGECAIKNALGFAVATLIEYSVLNASGDKYTLYRTKEGNWYDMDTAIPSNKAIGRALKAAIEQDENGFQ